jgi:hypothetical protein
MVWLEFFIDVNLPAALIVALGSTEPVTEMNSRNISWGGGGIGGRADITLHHLPVVLKSGSQNLLEPSGPAHTFYSLPGVLLRNAFLWIQFDSEHPDVVVPGLNVRAKDVEVLNNHFFLFQLNARDMLNTYIYHQLPPTCLSPVTSYMFIASYLLHVYHQLPPTCLSPVTSYMFISSYLLRVYHQLPPTCFGDLLLHFQGDHCVTCLTFKNRASYI